MYQSLLTRRYLTSKVMPLLASLAVVLCTAMVLISWSVMGGFLATLLSSGRTLIGDVLIAWPNTGFGHYEDLIKRLEADPDIEAATPVIESYGLVGLPNGRNETVIIKGIEPDSFSKVTGFYDTLWWKPMPQPLPKDKNRDDTRLRTPEGWAKVLENGRTMQRGDTYQSEDKRPAVVMGIEVSGMSIRQPGGWYTPYYPTILNPDGSTTLVQTLLPQNGFVTLNVLPLDSKGRVLETVTRRFPVANEFQTGLYEVDNRTVLVPLESLQDMLNMNRAKRLVDAKATRAVTIDPATGQETFNSATGQQLIEDPARVTTVYVKGRPVNGRPPDANQLAIKCQEIYDAFAEAHRGQVPGGDIIRIATWEDQNRTLINAVKKETGLVLFIFSFISLTAVFLVLAIFWSMVSEKTKDVGVLRSLGASRAGIAWLWLRYGLAIGIVGALLGGLLAYLIVTNINPIHDWMGRALGITIWDPRIYYFTVIPNRVDLSKAIIVMAVGVLSSVLGALWPAIRAARMDPVKALRFE
ncbi:MAG: FtsX-like permease family protein [Phycisphaerales bacterium]|nr:FtsX-like permease family protein [Phycisphaerales bacterium]